MYPENGLPPDQRRRATPSAPSSTPERFVRARASLGAVPGAPVGIDIAVGRRRQRAVYLLTLFRRYTDRYAAARTKG